MEITPKNPPTALATGRLERVVIRSFPKAIFLYPTLVIALVSAFAMSLDLGTSALWGALFMTVFGLNIAVLAFEFPRTTSISLLLLIVAIGLGGILLNQRVVFLPSLRDVINDIAPEANNQFYWVISCILGVMILIILAIHRWIDYWEVFSNELIHHHGVLGNLERYPAPGIKMEKEITDVFEFFILGAGRLVLTVPTEGRAIVLENVPHINRIERSMKEVLGVTEVEINRT